MVFKQVSFFLPWHLPVLAVNGMYECEINIGIKEITAFAILGDAPMRVFSD